ncbi:MAG: hypothetical protein VKJ63_04700 [Synechococcus sp.]|nr:hypothetical protein [Synechococcus sp.]
MFPSEASITFDCDSFSSPYMRDGFPTLETEVVYSDSIITKKEVNQAVKGWRRALVAISQENQDNGIEAAEALAADVIDAAYGYQLGAVAFKPTWASGDTTFRTTREGAISYFVGENDAFDDLGFALGNKPDPITGERSPWVRTAFDRSVLRLDGDTATVQGLLYTTDADGNTGYVDKTWGFQKDDAGVVRIILHHSSVPYESVEDPSVDKIKRVKSKTVDLSQNITLQEVLDAQEAWVTALVEISQRYKDDPDDAIAYAEAVIDGAYAYDYGPVAFKPTWAFGDSTFRPDKEGALSYFVGGNDAYDDLGFGIGSSPDSNGDRSPWEDAWAENAVIRLDGDTAYSMGWVYTQPENGDTGFVDKSWSYKKHDDGVVRIVMHHSSSPYA